VRLEDANAFDINVAMVYPTTDPGADAYEAHYDVVFTKYLLDEAPVAGLTVRFIMCTVQEKLHIVFCCEVYSDVVVTKLLHDVTIAELTVRSFGTPML